MKLDMSPHAITMRIKKASELRRLCIALGSDRLKEKLHDIRIRKIVPTGQHKSDDNINP